MAKKVLLVSTSAGQMGEHPTGLWISELASRTVFTNRLDVTIASIAGGPCRSVQKVAGLTAVC